MNRRVRLTNKQWWRLTTVYAVMMALLAVIPVGTGISGGSLDKLLHVAEYLLLSWCMAQAMNSSGKARRWGVAACVSAIYGVMLEGVQYVLPYRQAEWLDAVANIGGAAVGAWLGWRWPAPAHRSPGGPGPLEASAD